jgi:ribosomal protein L20
VVPLPDIYVTLEWKIDGKWLAKDKKRVLSISDGWIGFRSELGRLCNPKLPKGMRYLDHRITISYQQAWITRKKAETKNVQIGYTEMDDEDDFESVQHAVRTTKLPGDYTLKVLATIRTTTRDSNEPESEEEFASLLPGGRQVVL